MLLAGVIGEIGYTPELYWVFGQRSDLFRHRIWRWYTPDDTM